MKKNLLYIFADQWRYHALGCVGEDSVFTPNMDSFAKESLSFTNAVSTYPLCSPHRAALLTGKYPLSCGMWTNCKTGLFLSPTLAPQEVTLGDILKKEGYDTAYIGKWHLDGSDLNYYKKPEAGTEGWDAYTPPGERRHGFDYWHSYGAMDRHLHPHYFEGSSNRICVDEWSPAHERKVLENYLENIRDKDKPFAAVLSWNPPHPPYDQVPSDFMQYYKEDLPFRENVPDSMRKDEHYLDNFRSYYCAVSGLDHEFGLIIDFLKSHDLYDDTCVVLSSDHGDCMGSHGLYGKNIWYEESIHIPLYIHDSALPSGYRNNLVESCDHLPTILEILDIGIPDTVEGSSALSCNKEHAFLCMMPGMGDLVDAYLKLGYDSKCFGWRGIRTKTHTYVINSGTGPCEKQERLLYDNANDKYQLHPVRLKKDDRISLEYDEMIRRFCEIQKDPFVF